MNDKHQHPITGESPLGFRADGRPIFRILGADDSGDAAVATRLAELDGEISRVSTELVAFADVAEPDEAQTSRFAELEAEHQRLTDERAPIAHRAEVIERVRSAQSRGRGLESASGRRGPEVSNRVQPFENLDAVVSRSLPLGDLQSRALAAIETAGDGVMSDDQRERAELLVRRHDRQGRIARHMLLTGSDDYARAFEAVLGGVKPWNLPETLRSAFALGDEAQRALNEGTQGDGGYLVPFYLDPTIILTNAGSINPFRQISRVETISTNKWHGITSAGVTASYRGEAVETTDASPTVAQPEIDVVKADAYLQASFEAMQDTGIVASFGMLLADAKDNFEAEEMAVGDGAAGHLQGVVTGVVAAGGASLVKTGTAATFAIADVWKLREAIRPRWRRNQKWVAELATYDRIRQFATGSGQQSGSFWTDLGGDTPPLLIGKPTYEASAMDSTTATGKNILVAGDYQAGYLIVDRIGMSVQYNPLVVGPNGRPTGEAGWYAYWRTGAGVVNAAALAALQVL